MNNSRMRAFELIQYLNKHSIDVVEISLKNGESRQYTYSKLMEPQQQYQPITIEGLEITHFFHSDWLNRPLAEKNKAIQKILTEDEEVTIKFSHGIEYIAYPS